MDYTKTNLSYKIKKFLRYVSLYGVSRTLVKVKSQYHMNKEYPTPPSINVKTGKRHVGILGCGKFSFGNLAYYLRKNHGNVIKGAMDIDQNKAISLTTEYKACYYTVNEDEVINDPDINMIYVASNHATHAPYAIKAIEQGKHVHIEKPHAVSVEQLVDLCKAIKTSNSRINLGFNRPKSTLFQRLKKEFAEQPGELMINWFVAGHEIDPDHWYFADGEGGRVLGNLCHWTDLTLQLIPEENRFPVRIIPSRSKKSDCDISVTMVFGDGSIGTITFSAKGHTFEGVRETLNAHKGNVLAQLNDFKSLRLDNLDKKVKKTRIFRDHGHQSNVLTTYKLLDPQNAGEPVEYIWNTGFLVLKVKEALETQKEVVIEDFDVEYPKLLKQG